MVTPSSKFIATETITPNCRRSCDTSKSTMQQTTLPHRVVRSAKDLASATLSGATFELKDSLDSKHAGSSSQASTSSEHLSSGSVQQRPELHARGSSFRNETDESHREKAEQEFGRFQLLDDFQSEFTACLASLHDKLEPQEGPFDLQKPLLTGPTTKSNETTQAAEIITIDANESILRNELASDPIIEKDVNTARTAAVRRLNQIGAHLQRNLAMQTLQQEAYLQSHASMDETRSLVVDQLTRQADDEVRNATHTDEAESSRHGIRNMVAPQHLAPVASVESAPESSSEKEDEVLQRQFHCPYYACHRNLKLHSTSSSNSSKRQCVHVGCGFNAETFSSWAEHIHMPHHDLLGSI